MKFRFRHVSVLLTGLLVLYLLLLIPGLKSDPPPSGTASPFVWNQDEYWLQLENSFLRYRGMSGSFLSDSIKAGLNRVETLLDSCSNQKIEPEAPLLARLEKAVFELSPLVAARPGHLSDFIEIHSRLRKIVKNQSLYWNMNSAVARDRLYRLLFGTRTAVEEVMLQRPPDSVPSLTRVAEEPSSTPVAEIMGVPLHSGDILISRGGAPTSALIARGNDYPGNFSHVALVYIDGDTHEVSIIESHIECGVAVASIDQYLEDTKLRILILRLRADHPALVADSMLPHKAATLALERARKEHIPYDFEMDFRDDTKLFCSEVASNAYTRLGVRLWMGLSNISSPGIRDWLAAFGVKDFETQEPSDLEYDPQLRVVAEWLDPETLYQDHLDNAVIDVMLEEAEKGKRLDYDWYMLPLARLAKGYSLLKNLAGSVGPIPEGMSAAAALKNEKFSKRHSEVKKRLMRLAEEFQQSEGYRPPYWELIRLARQANKEQV